MRSPKFKQFSSKTLITGIYLLSQVSIIFGQQLINSVEPTNQQVDKQTQQTATNVPKPFVSQVTKIGLAPHDRLACQLPPISHHQRRNHHSAAASGELSQAENNQTRSSNQLSVTQPAFMTLSTGAAAPVVGGTVNSLEVKSQLVGKANKRFDSSERLRQLRQLLASNSYDAYLVTPNDEHGSEYTSNHDRRLQFISGFTGSNGFALILLDRAVLFTDGRYTLQADQELDCNWWLVVNDDPLTDIPLWLKANAANGLKIATDARLMSLQSFDYLDEHFRRQDSEFALISQDLIDVVWANQVSAGDASRSQFDEEPLMIHPIQFAGNVSWQEKLVKVADQMNKLRARHYIVSQLDDIAWLLNLRGNDIPQAPLFKAYALISRSLSAEQRQSNGGLSVDQLLASQQQQTTAAQRIPTQQQALQSPQVLQVQASQSIKLTLYVDLKKIDQQIRDYLHVSDNETIVVHPIQVSQKHQLMEHLESNSVAVTTTKIQVELKDYEVFVMDIRDKLNPASNSRQLQGKLLLNAGANVAIHVLAKTYEDRLVLVESLINKLKGVKSEGEVQGMRLAHWRDSLAIAMLLAQLNEDIGQRGLVNKWSEVSAAKELEFYRSLMDHNKGESFPSISAYGSNAAIVHYSPNYDDEQNSRLIGNQSTYLLDCGGQYLDGTTDITRTLHYGQPNEFQRETYTRVLMGAIDMMSLIFDQPTRGAYRLNDLMARRHLFELGLDYAHGTGHGIGLYSMVHEAPWLIENYSTGTNAKRQQQSSTNSKQSLVHSEPIPLQPNMFTSVEPGYYKANDFGIRLENIVVTQRVNPPASFNWRPNDRQDSKLSNTDNRQFLRFEPLSLVPFEPKLIKTELLSNKQKAWLNSYNLMVRLRMTQQINYYLEKIRRNNHQQSLTESMQVQGSASSSRIYQQLLQKSSNFLNQTKKDELGFSNYLRLEASQFQEKLEKTHKWIMSKTELIPLDLPQSLLTNNNQQQAIKNSSSASEAHVNRKRAQTGEQHSTGGSNLDAQRLMLVYMASLPFNDHDAGEAVAANLNNELALNGRMNPLAMSESNDYEEDISGSNNKDGSRAHLTEGNKCSGFECDLWLLSSLNRASSSPSSVREQRQKTTSGWPFGANENTQQQQNSRTGNLFDLFHLNGSSSSSSSILPINMWSLLIIGLLVVVQLAIVSFVCRGKRRKSNASANLCHLPTQTTTSS